MKTFLISPRHSLIEVIMGHLSGGEGDYSTNLVVFPGKRPSHFLRKALAEKESASFLPPRIFSMDEFIDELYEEGLGLRKRKLESIDAVAILHEIHKTSSEPLGRRSFLSADTFFPVGLKLYSDLEELYIEGIAPLRVREVDATASENIPEPTAKRLQSLSDFYEAFYQAVEEAGYSTRSSRYREISLHLARVSLDSFSRIIFAGFFALTASEKKIFKSLKDRDEVIFVFQDGSGIDISELGMQAEREYTAGEPVVHFFKSPDTHGQVLGLSSILKNMMESGESLDENTVIVLPSADTLFPLLQHTLTLLTPEQYNISLGYPLQRTPLFGLFNTLMELILSMDGDRLYVPHYLKFILHPYIKNIYFDGRAEITRIVFHTIEEALTEKKSKKFVSLSEIEKNETIIRLITDKILNLEPDVTLEEIKVHLKEVHKNTIKKMLSCENVGDFAMRLRGVIEYIYHNSTARLHPFFYPYSESFAIQLDLISRSLMAKTGFEEMGSYFNLVKKVIATAYTPFIGTPLKGVQVLGFLETRNIKFKKILFLDVNEGIIPEMAKEDTLLPFKVRQMLGLPTYLEREKLMAYYFDTLIKGAQAVYLLYVENAEKERSRFVEKLLWERQKEEKQADDRSYVKTIQYSVTLQEKRPLVITKSEEVARFLKNYTFSATSLNTYLKCPLMFYYEYVLGLREKEMVLDELEREEIGLLVHQVLFEYFKEKMEKPLSERDMSLRGLEKIIQDHFDEQYGKNPAGEIYLLKRQIEKHLKDFIIKYQIPKIREIPIKLICLEHRFDVKINSFKLTARLDRVENRNGRTTIIDYKTSANKHYLSINFNKLDPAKKESWSEAIGSLQLPFYMTVYSQSTGKNPNDIDCLFLLLGRNIIDTSIELPLFEDREEFDQKFGLLNHIIFGLLREIVNPREPFTPAADTKNQCVQCIYKHVCN